MSCSKPSPYIILVEVDLNLAVQRLLFQKCSGFFRCFWSNLALFQLVVKPLYLLWWSLLLIVDLIVTRLPPGECSSLDCRLDSDTSASWRVFFSWLDVVNGVFFTMERILWSSTTVVLRGRLGFLCCWAHQCVPLFSECTKLLIWSLRMSLLSLWWIGFVFEA